MPGPWQIVLIVVLVAVLFGGRGKITSIMGDMASGIKAFRKGLKDEEEAKAESPAALAEEAKLDVSAEKTKSE